MPYGMHSLNRCYNGCMNQRTLVIANAFLIGIAFVIGIFLFPGLPAQMADHWSALGKTDGTLPKAWGVFLLPAIMLLLLCVSLLLPKIDPMHQNVKQFRTSYQNFFFWIGVFLFYVYLLTLGWNLGWRFSMLAALIPAFAALWFIVGVLLARVKRNWFVGIRTPWTMESELVWDKTHRLGSLLFRISAGIMLLALFVPQYTLWILLAPIALSIIACVVYSYIEYRRERV